MRIGHWWFGSVRSLGITFEAKGVGQEPLASFGGRQVLDELSCKLKYLAGHA